jgi:hypothetical protein
MSLLNVSGSSYASEINLTDSLGYGIYTFVIQGDLSKLDKNAVLGIFTWDDSGNDTLGNAYNREIDMEMTRWGNASDMNNAEVGVQPETQEAISRYRIGYAGNITASMDWKPGEVDFRIRQASPPYAEIEQWNYTGNFTPTPGREKLRINLWAFEEPTTNNVTVVIQNFNFTKN